MTSKKKARAWKTRARYGQAAIVHVTRPDTAAPSFTVMLIDDCGEPADLAAVDDERIDAAVRQTLPESVTDAAHVVAWNVNNAGIGRVNVILTAATGLDMIAGMVKDSRS